MKISRKRWLWFGLLAALALAAFWARRGLLERWRAIPSKGGETMTVGVMMTPHYLQRDSRWADETVGGTGERLARVGCTVCSLAMALDHHGIKATPKVLNDFLKANDGYTIRGWLRWESVPRFTQGKVAMDYIGRPGFERIDRALKANQPVIAKLLIKGIIPHWVLIVGKEQTEYLMRDPLGDGKTVEPLAKYDSRIYAIRILKTAR